VKIRHLLLVLAATVTAGAVAKLSDNSVAPTAGSGGGVGACDNAASALASASPFASTVSDSPPEETLARIFAEIEANRLGNALQLTEALLRQHPNYRLANLIKGDLLLARRSRSDFGALSDAPADKVADLRAEALARLKAYRDKPPANFVPRYLLQMQPDQRYAIVVDTQRSRLYLYENDRSQDGRPRFVADYYITHGKLGAEKSRRRQENPGRRLSRHRQPAQQKLADLLRQRRLPAQLPQRMGQAAGTQRQRHLAARHALRHLRPPAARLRRLRRADQPGSRPGRQEPAGRPDPGHHQPVGRVAVTRRLGARTQGTEQDHRVLACRLGKPRHRPLPEPLLQALQGRQPEFEEFASQKKQVNASKEWIKVKVNNLSVFRNPGKEEVVVVTFEQDYRSNNLDNQMKKRQYWLREDGHWKIIYEGSA
jgi:hypothetical protein